MQAVANEAGLIVTPGPSTDEPCYRLADELTPNMTRTRLPILRPLMALALMALLAAGWSHAATEADLLPPDEAFAISAMALDRAELQITWKIADGYYMYRHQFRFQTTTPGVMLGTPMFPPGKVKEDEFFGVVETYMGRLDVLLPVTVMDSLTGEVELTLQSQGCNEPIGVCYPPHTQTVTVSLPRLAGGLGLTAGSGSSLAAQLGLDSDGLLPPDQAFMAEAAAIDGQTILARWLIAEGYYLYRDKFSFVLENAGGAALGEIEFPEGIYNEDDEFFGPMVVYYDQVELAIPVLRADGSEQTASLLMRYQGCNEPIGVCYPPLEKRVLVTLPATDQIVGALPAPAGASEDAPGAPASMGADEPVAEHDRIARAIAGKNVWITALTFFGFGLLLAFTPCVFPMVPILSGIIAGQGETITTRRGFVLSLIFVLAMAVTYTAAGVFAGLFGHNLQAAFQNQWILIGFAAVFVLLSLAMFGFYELQLPSSWQTRLAKMSDSQRGGTYIGVAIMGLLSALIVGPCVAAPLAGALIYIGQTGDGVLGGLALFSMSLGMGVPLLAVGTSAARWLPKAGPWMDAVKAVFGVALLGVALWLLERILSPTLIMFLWGVLLIGSAVYLGVLDRRRDGPAGWQGLRRALAILLLLLGVLEIVGAAAGGRDWLRPLHGIGSQRELTAPEFTMVSGLADLDRELASAAAAGKPALFDFYADWCVDCKRMERYTFPEPVVRAALEGVVLLKVDVTDNNTEHQTLLKHFELYGPPATLFFDRQGQERRNYRLLGFQNAERFARHIEQAFHTP